MDFRYLRKQLYAVTLVSRNISKCDLDLYDVESTGSWGKLTKKVVIEGRPKIHTVKETKFGP